MLVKQQFVQIDVSDLDRDRLVRWLVNLDFWDSGVEKRVLVANGYLPIDLEYQLKDQYKLPFDENTLDLFGQLLSSDIGLSLESLGFKEGGWRNPDSCVGKILFLKLGRVQDGVRFKPLPIAFDPRAQYLVGFRKYPN